MKKNRTLTTEQIVGGLMAQAAIHAKAGQVKRAGEALIEAAAHDEEVFDNMMDQIAVMAGEESSVDADAAPTKDDATADVSASTRSYFSILGAGKKCNVSAGDDEDCEDCDDDDDSDDDEGDEDADMSANVTADVPESVATLAARLNNATW